MSFGNITVPPPFGAKPKVDMCFWNKTSTLLVDCNLRETHIKIKEEWEQWCTCEDWYAPPSDDPQWDTGERENSANDRGCVEGEDGVDVRKYTIKKKRFEGPCGGYSAEITDVLGPLPEGTCDLSPPKFGEWEDWISWESVVNLLTALYHSPQSGLPAHFEGRWKDKEGRRHMVVNNDLMEAAKKCGAQKVKTSSGEALDVTRGVARCMGGMMCCMGHEEYDYDTTYHDREAVMEQVYKRIIERLSPKIICYSSGLFGAGDF